MAAAIDTTATTLEGQILEVLTAAQALETTPANNPQNRNFVTLTINTDTSVMTSNVNLPVAYSVGANGKIEISASPYLV